MHDHAELAGERHLCLLHAGAFGKPHRPALEGCAALERLGQDNVAGLVERRSHSLVADLADPSPSRPREFHPQSLTEPCLTLSRHTARAIVGRHHPSAALSGSSRFRLAQRNYDGLLPSLQSHYRTFITIPRSRHDPKILWVDDAEIVGDRITKVRPIPRNLFTQKTERRIGELGASCVALVVSDVSVHEAP